MASLKSRKENHPRDDTLTIFSKIEFACDDIAESLRRAGMGSKLQCNLKKHGAYVNDLFNHKVDNYKLSDSIIDKLRAKIALQKLKQLMIKYWATIDSVGKEEFKRREDEGLKRDLQQHEKEFEKKRAERFKQKS